jgi:hypothetical protein
MICGNFLPNGNIQVEQMAGDILVGDSSRGCAGNTQPKGNIKIEQNVVTFLGVASNVVGQNLQVFTNSGPGPKFVQCNTVAQVLQCKENTAPRSCPPRDEGAAGANR